MSLNNVSKISVKISYEIAVGKEYTYIGSNDEYYSVRVTKIDFLNGIVYFEYLDEITGKPKKPKHNGFNDFDDFVNYYYCKTGRGEKKVLEE